MEPFDDIDGRLAERRLKRLFWFICLIGWSALVTVTASFLSQVTTLPIRFALQLALGFWGFYALATPLVLWLARRFPLNRGSWRSNIWVHFGGMILFVVLCEGGFMTMVHFFEPQAAAELDHRQQLQKSSLSHLNSSGAEKFDNGLPEPSLRLMLFKAQFGIPFYWVLVGAAHSLATMIALREREKQAAQLATHLTQAQLAELRTQLQPHFLFNTLNSIAALIPQNAMLATEMVMNLSDLLRMTLRDPQRGEILLSEEIKLLQHYVDIQRLRFGERLTFQIEITDGANNASVPPLLLQPLVENAIRHGLEASEQNEIITVSGRMDGDQLLLEVANTFSGEPDECRPPTSSTGVGLANTEARLKVQYSDKHTFQAGPCADGGFQVTMKFPARSRATHPITKLNHED